MSPQMPSPSLELWFFFPNRPQLKQSFGHLTHNVFFLEFICTYCNHIDVDRIVAKRRMQLLHTNTAMCRVNVLLEEREKKHGLVNTTSMEKILRKLKPVLTLSTNCTIWKD